MRRELYPKNWEEISRKIRNNSGGRCECDGECRIDHLNQNNWHPEEGYENQKRCSEINGRKARNARGKIILTVAHLCHHPECIDEDHMKSYCQSCHLRYDNMIKMRKLKSKRAKNQAELQLTK